jgi:hypothetical protein
MTTAEDQQRRDRQRRALTLHGGGALIESEYHSRTSKVVPVNETDLRDLLSLDAVELGLTGFGQFMASGSLWLFLDKYMEPNFTWNALSGFCAASFIFGVILFAAGLGMRMMKRGRINRIFNETRPGP